MNTKFTAVPSGAIDPKTIKISSKGNTSSALTAEAPAINKSQPCNTAHADQKTPPTQILSRKTLVDWQGSVTTFQGFTGTRPVHELENGSWGEVTQFLRPDNPAVLSDKKQGQYFVPCLLKEAQLVGNTLEAAEKSGEPSIGKMRSKTHVTEAAMLVIDADGLLEADFMAGLGRIASDGITYLAYTTYSHGSEEKPGVRARLVVPQDRPLSIAEYTAAWHGFDAKYLAGAAGKADASGANMYQQQGAWACHPARIDKANSWAMTRGVASADALIEIGHAAKPAVQQRAPLAAVPNHTVPNQTVGGSNNADSEYPDSDANKIADACKQIGKFRDTQGADQSEPHWRDCLGVVGRCIGGEKTCHEWSGGHAGYDEDATDRKLAHRLKTAPTTCDQFRKSNPEGCIGCEQQCRSPITLGWSAEPLDEFKVIQPPPDDFSKVNALAAMQQQFGLINMDGKVCVFDRIILGSLTEQGMAKKLVMSTRSDGGLLIQRAVRAAFSHSDAAAIVKEFWISPQTACYEGVEFNPVGTSVRSLNLWVGPTIKTRAGSWRLIEAFLLEVICDGDQGCYRYLIFYIAHALQCPEEKPGVMIILLGGQGIGKGTVGRILRKIWSATFLQVHNIDAVTGSFNAALERTFIIFMDEALFSGDRRAADALKSLVTEPVIHINEKHQPARQTGSYHRFFAATNAAHFKNTDRDDRRDFSLRVSESRKGDHGYWEALSREIDDAGVAAMAHDLLEMDLSGFNVRDKPDTPELLEQKLRSLEPIERWWHDYLDSGGERWPDFISTEDAIVGIVEVSGGKLYRKPAAIEVVQALLKLCPGARKKQVQLNYARQRGLSLPPLAQAREEFEQYIGGKVTW